MAHSCVHGFILIALLWPGAIVSPATARSIQTPVVQTSHAAQLNAYLERAAAFGFSGQVLVAERGHVLLHRAYGLADREFQRPMTTETLFNIGSLTKQFTAAAILRLEMDGKLQTADTLGKYLPEVPPDKAEITIHQLLTHTAGLKRDAIRQTETVTREEAVRRILASPLESKPGEKFHYANAGYQLLAAIIETASGQSYEDYITQKLLTPAGLTHTGFFSQSRWEAQDVARGYNEWKEIGAFPDWPRSWNHTGSGNIVSTADDLYRWHLALQTDRILSKQAREKLFTKATATPEGDFYGYGWFVGKAADGGTLISHGGDNIGYRAEFRWYVEPDRVVILLTNQDLYGYGVQRRVMASNLAHILAGEDYKSPPPVIRLSLEAMRRYTGIYTLLSGASFKIWLDADHLALGARGRQAIDALAYPNRDPDPANADRDARATAILQGITSGKDDQVKTALSADQYRFVVPFLTKQVRGYESAFGTFKSLEMLGTAPLPWEESPFRTYAVLTFEDGRMDVFLGWYQGQINDVTTGEGRPFPVILPLAPQSRTDFATFDLVTSKSVPLHLQLDRKGFVIGLTIATRRGDITARKVR